MMATLRMRDRYFGDVVPALKTEFGYTSTMAVPRIVAIKLNMGIGKKILQKQDEGKKKGVKRATEKRTG